MIRRYRHSLLALLGAVAVAGVCVAAFLQISGSQGRAENKVARRSALQLADIPIDGERAYGYLKALCDLGPRRSGSEGMAKQQQLAGKHFQKLGGAVYLQEFRVRHPQTGQPVQLANLIVQWHPERRERILLCAHYDTRPFPDRDEVNPRGTFLGANDGASGTALLMELGHHMGKLEGSLGVDFVLLDGEEFVFDERDPMFLGSEKFARAYVDDPPGYRYRWGVVLDMIGDSDLQIYKERNSNAWPEVRPLVTNIWNTASRLGVSEFSDRVKTDVLDDHIKLRNVGKIPTCVIIDFPWWEHWHTERDTPERCSPLSLAKVGWVVHEWLKSAVAGK